MPIKYRLRTIIIIGAFSALLGHLILAAPPEDQKQGRTEVLSKSFEEAFPEADPEDVGIPAEALDRLAERVQTMVDQERIVGGELIVIKNRSTVLRQAFGWQDREARKALEIGSVYCVRSMTKPLVGTAIQMLIDDGRLRLDTPVHEILPFFAGPETGKITIEHLLTHTGGLPLTTLARPLSDYTDLAEVAVEAAATDLGFEPGSRFRYSDAGSDTLGAIVAEVTGAPVERFIQERILDPLGMKETFPLLGGNNQAIARVPSAYSGGTGMWSKHWQPSDPPIFPLFLASQSLYSTTTDYARFLALWMDDGRLGDQRLLSAEAVRRALEPDQQISHYPKNEGGMDAYYAQQWMVFTRPDESGAAQPVLFGHDGSDGTHAWAWPQHDLMVLFFTQSRGTLAGLGLESVLQALLIEHKLDASPATRVANATELEQVEGLFWDETNQGAYYVISRQGDRLLVERPGQMYAVFKAGTKPARYVHEASPQVWIEFVRAGDGAVTAMRTFFGDRIELNQRHQAAAGLPSADEVIDRVQQAHRIDRLSELGVVRLSGRLHFKTRGFEGPTTTLFDTSRYRSEFRLGSAEEIVVIDNGRVWSHNTATGTDELEGSQREQALLDRVSVRLGNWAEHYESVEVLKRVQAGDNTALLVRVVPHEAPGSTIFVDEETGLVGRTDSLAQIPGLGVVGIQTRYGDFRDVGGMQLPFRSDAKFASKLIGRVVMMLDSAETGAEISQETFTPPAASGR